MKDATLRSQGYFDDPWYQSQEYKDKLAAAEEIEQARQDLVAGRANERSLAYAWFLLIVEDDATINRTNGQDDDDLVRRWPFFSGMIK